MDGGNVLLELHGDSVLGELLLKLPLYGYCAFAATDNGNRIGTVINELPGRRFRFPLIVGCELPDLALFPSEKGDAGGDKESVVSGPDDVLLLVY